MPSPVTAKLSDFGQIVEMTETEKVYENNPLFTRSKRGIILQQILMVLLYKDGYDIIDAPRTSKDRSDSNAESDFHMFRDGTYERVEVKSSFLLAKSNNWRLRWGKIKTDFFDTLFLIACYPDEIIVYEYSKDAVVSSTIEICGRISDGPNESASYLKEKMRAMSISTKYVIKYT